MRCQCGIIGPLLNSSKISISITRARFTIRSTYTPLIPTPFPLNTARRNLELHTIHHPREPAASIRSARPEDTGPRKRKADLADLLTIPHNRLLRIRRLCKEFRIGRISPSFVIERSRSARWPPLIHLRPWPERTQRELLHSVAAPDIHMYPVFRALSDRP